MVTLEDLSTRIINVGLTPVNLGKDPNIRSVVVSCQGDGPGASGACLMKVNVTKSVDSFLAAALAQFKLDAGDNTEAAAAAAFSPEAYAIVWTKHARHAPDSAVPLKYVTEETIHLLSDGDELTLGPGIMTVARELLDEISGIGGVKTSSSTSETTPSLLSALRRLASELQNRAFVREFDALGGFSAVRRCLDALPSYTEPMLWALTSLQLILAQSDSWTDADTNSSAANTNCTESISAGEGPPSRSARRQAYTQRSLLEFLCSLVTNAPPAHRGTVTAQSVGGASYNSLNTPSGGSAGGAGVMAGSPGMAAENPLIPCKCCALQLLSIVLEHARDTVEIIQVKITMRCLVTVIDSTMPALNVACLRLVTNLLRCSKSHQRQHLRSGLLEKANRDTLHVLCVFHSTGAQAKVQNREHNEIVRHLSTLQRMLLEEVVPLLETKFNPSDKEMKKDLMDVCSKAFPTNTQDNNHLTQQHQHRPHVGGSGSGSGAAQKRTSRLSTAPYKRVSDLRRLGFRDPENPGSEFQETPPGILPLHCLAYFARTHADSFQKVVLENTTRADEHDTPLIRASIELCRVLVDIFRIGQQPTQPEEENFSPMLFKEKDAFNELFCSSLILLARTWQEMRAVLHDMPKVLNVVREQLELALQERVNTQTFDAFSTTLKGLGYKEVLRRKKERANKDPIQYHLPPIVKLKEKVTKSMLELVQRQRINFLIHGRKFRKPKDKPGRKERDYIYSTWSLMPNQKTLIYTDHSEDAGATPDFAVKVPVAEVVDLKCGRDCTHCPPEPQKRRQKDAADPSLYYLTIVTNQHQFNLICEDSFAYDHWCDGLNFLLKREMKSNRAKDDLDTLVSLELQVRLLEVEGLEIPKEEPTVPPLPPADDPVLLGNGT